MQGKIRVLIIALVVTTLIFGNNINYTRASTSQTCYSLVLVVDSGMGQPPIASPSNCARGLYEAGSVVDLIARPDPRFTVSAWRGTADDTSAAVTNAVVMTSDQEVGVSYSPVPTGGEISAQVSAQVNVSGESRVIVTLQDPVSIQTTGSAREAAVAQVQAVVLADLLPTGFELTRQYSHIPALAGTVDAETLAALQQNPWVASVQIDGIVHATTDISVPAINADDVHAMGITGNGVTVAVLDTGIDTNHADLNDDIVAQRCFNNHPSAGKDCPPGNTAQSSSAEDENGHGTNVSGIITSNGTIAPRGFAPDAKIVSVRVLNSAGSGTFSDILAGLDWIIDNQSTLNVDIVNMSLGGSTYAGNCDYAFTAMAEAFDQLNALGVVIFAASGNNTITNAISIPACMSHVISVGAVYDSNMGREPDKGYEYTDGVHTCHDDTSAFGKIACFSNRSRQLDILAPGARITSTGMGGGTITMFGTSQASPAAAGVAALLLQVNPTLTPSQLESTLKKTGISTTDPKNGLVFPRIDALNAVKFITRPVLTKPKNDAAKNSTNPTFTWKAVYGATQYQILVDNDSNFSSLIVDATLTGTSFTPGPSLSDGLYYWRVRAYTSGFWGGWSARWPFTIDTRPPAAPTLQSPANRAATSDHTPTLRWGSVRGAVRYTLQVDNNADFSSPVINHTQVATAYTPGSGILTTGRYYWRVCALDAAGNISAWSAHWFIRIKGAAAAPQPDALIPTPDPTNTPTPTEVIELPTPTEAVTDGLLRVETDQPAVQQSGAWTSHVTDVASGGSYLYSSGSFDDILSLTFAGTQIEVIYVKHPALGTFAVEVDGAVMQLVNSTAADSEFGAVAVISGLSGGPHGLRIYPVAGVVALDAFGVEALSDVPPQDITPTEVPPDQPTQDTTPTEVPPGDPTLTPTPTNTPLPVLLPFVETFDGGLNWQPVGAWTFDTQTAYQGAGWFAESLTRGQSSTLTFTAQIDLRTALNPELDFWHKMALVNEDVFALDVSLDSGLTWLALDQQAGQVIDWTQRTLDLTAYRGQVIVLRFRLDTLNVLPEGAVTTGVWIDELVIREALPTPTQILPTSTPVPPTETALPTDVPTETPLPTDVPTETPLPTEIPTETPLPTEIPADAPMPTEESAS